jgi:N-acetylglucosamine kinase-like BadF-type ATPase
MFVLAVDGGNSKTDAALLRTDGTLLSWVRGPGSALAPGPAAELIAALAESAALSAGLPRSCLRSAHAACYLAGVDVPWQAAARRSALEAVGAFGSLEVRNDAWPLLRLGAPAGARAVGVVCGAGLKCVARSGDAEWEFPSLGWQTGDLSGAGDFLAREAVRAAARAEDGRGPETALVHAVCTTLSAASVRAVGEALLARTLTEDRLSALAPVVLDLAREGDPVAESVVRELASEVAAMSRAARRQVSGDGEWTLALGGGLFADPAARLLDAIRTTTPALEKEFKVTVVAAPPVAGAALLGLDHLAVTAPTEQVTNAFRTAAPTVPTAPPRRQPKYRTSRS